VENFAELYADLEVVNQIGKTTDGWNRLAFTPEERAAVDYFLNCSREIGLKTRVDALGNAYARWEGENPNSPVVLCGSHLDTVINGGPLDGVLGVFAALEAVRIFKKSGKLPFYPIEIVAFACEESSRFGVATIGSKVIAGLIDKEKLSQLKDRDGVSFEQAIQRWGYTYGNLSELVRTDLRAYLEMHIEQGPTLEVTGDELGIVTAIAAPTRFKIVVKGVAAHSGATAMSYRRDALAGAAEFILTAEKWGKKEEPAGTVVTVGVCDVLPGSMNVVPGEVRLQLDIRSIDSDSKKRVVHALQAALKEICQARKLEVESTSLGDDEPVFMSEELNKLIQEICAKESIKYREMPSGAGHDAMNLKMICPAALIFVPSQDGISHNPKEYTSPQDISAGVRVLYQALVQLTQKELQAET